MNPKTLIPCVHFTFRDALRCTTAGLSNSAHAAPGVELLLDLATGSGFVCRKDAITFIGGANLGSAQIDPAAVPIVKQWLAEQSAKRSGKPVAA